MKFKLLCATLAFAALPVAAQASETDCFPLCVQVAPGDGNGKPSRITGAANDDRDLPGGGARLASCDPGLMKQAEELNERIRPLRELAGYLRTPQGLVIKMVNDHVVKIPVWVGYAVDPVGAIRHRAADEARSRARSSLGDGNSCKAVSAGATGATAESTAEKHAI